MRIRNIKIKDKLILITMLTCIPIILIIGLAVIVWTQNTLRDSMLQNLSTQAEIMADNCKAALAFDDEKGAEDTLHAFASQPSIIYAGIFAENKLFSCYPRNDNDNNEINFSEIPSKKNYYFGDDFLVVSRKIVLDEKTLGTIIIKSNLDSLKAVFAQSVTWILLVLAIAIFIAYILSCKLQNIISRPLLGLAEVVKTISQEKKYSIRAQKRTDDEIGLLTDAFNEMLDQIQQRDVQLQEANETLENKVKARTIELTASNQQLESTAQKLGQSNKQLQDFVYIASHDLKEPVRKISSFGQILTASLAGKLSEDDHENLTFMIDGATRMQQMVDALLTYSRATTKALDFRDVDLNKIVEQLKTLELSIRLEDTGGTIEIPEPLPVIKGDSTQINQLLQNLIGNALKYHKMDIPPKVIVRAVEQDNGVVRIEIEDNGIGIKPEHYENVFVMFKRLHTKQEYEGSGIGLSVCKKIVERHEGEIGVRSEYGQGTTFWFTLKMLQTQENESENLITTSVS
ncbi:MAG: ATP-binding protein [Phycisphaerae bacterium]|nr:ATP-binding protein [Phycisphaerae bacterium]